MKTATDYYFLTIAETGNYTKAAQRLYVSQPSLTKYIQRLEEHLGTALLDRSAVPMRLTEAGEAYRRYLLDSLEREQQLFDEIGEINHMVRGTLRLGIPPFCGQCFLPKVLPVFSAEFRQVQIEVREMRGAEIEQALADQEIDLGIMHLPLQNSSLTYQPLTRERTLLVKQKSGKESTDTGEKSIRILEGTQAVFEGLPVIMPQHDQKMARIVADFFQKFDYQPEVYTSLSSVTTTLALAAEGVGVGFTPESGLDTVSESILNRLEFYSFENMLSDWPLVAVTRRTTVMNLFTRRFLKIFKDNTKNPILQN